MKKSQQQLLEPKTDKVWGTTSRICSTNHISVYELNLIPNSYCSFHYHKSKFNTFLLKSGKVDIITIVNDAIVRTSLVCNIPYCVPPLVRHMFVVNEGGLMIEIYTFIDDGSDDDIVRIIDGGDDFSNFNINRLLEK